MAIQGTAPADSFSVAGELTMGLFPGQNDAYHTRIDGERIETLIARILGFPSEMELEMALDNGMSPDPDQPAVVRTMPRINLSVFVEEV